MNEENSSQVNIPQLNEVPQYNSTLSNNAQNSYANVPNNVNPSQANEVQQYNNTLSNNVQNSYATNVPNNVNASQNNVQNNRTQHNVLHGSMHIDDELLDAYIGENADSIKTQGVSWPNFFFGMYYTVYRKMWPLSIALFIANVIMNIFLPSISLYIRLLLDLFVFFSFNKMYVEYAKDDIRNIIFQNPNASRAEIIQKCKEKGGTSVVAVIVLIIIYMLLRFLTLS